mmetsp:Transcript_13455/g.15420  ORF Transcript_13455/g.15420 Transcript_13455/m.15420 type:complete len:101 (-) Transcript_13455:167-469(-)|eukprot:CAMPEP_0176437620 /NCGR_PEP_ID=MMETSP0127-20121128/18744_1 /TAXON_ID=938130 /ORGANISM="Platyophrya macrostoma, Strain WH" /LENGTH=100 /DNA_ID=CAMNT_0017821309 /DNA_START=39 /DNA_END=341 /DNA_ORIENTATION=-
MSSMFVWGMCTGFLLRMGALRATRQNYSAAWWKLPKYMLGSGFFFTYLDWSRRISLETICVAEEKKDYQLKKAFLDKLVIGEEMEYKDLIHEVAVKNHRI